ncbi:uncharacterized protein KQ657_002051 [Scheffersomyces spartinae]|uniref:Uncharacterized protein n=1 Tax=Scheffersomyces spartinae TaxID=45513 RepID=A0A9P7V6Z8_9ASCO|nr:uncharacterized protein KQ657_002051 [Scheffersomyces spartinae]KAG7192332.1 hypothetical protein KQ657_002051 [Scheffersomyces spartinae]
MGKKHKKFLEYSSIGNTISALKAKYYIAKLRPTAVDFLKNKNINVNIQLVMPKQPAYANRFAVIYNRLKTINVNELLDIKTLINKARIPRAMADLFRFSGTQDNFRNDIKNIIGLTDLDIGTRGLNSNEFNKIIALETDIYKLNKLTEYISKYYLSKITSKQTFDHLKFIQNTYYLDNIKRTPPPLCRV